MDNKQLLDQALKQAKRQEDPYRLHYHLMPAVGWLNDPNGLCQYQGTYHIYYQFCPQDPCNGLKGWGHYTTKDFIHYQDGGLVLYPDHKRDAGGAYSGCAVALKDKIHYFYTGNVKHLGDYDYILQGREHNVMHVISRDGQVLENKEVIMTNDDYPSEMTLHVRDPKIYQRDGVDYLVLGARDQNDEGQVLVYQGHDLQDFQYCTTLKTKEPFGYMWECPDLFELNGQMILMCSPQGLDQEGYLYENLYQNGYFKVDEHFIENNYVDKFVELDHGFDIYAAQSFEDDKHRRILIGWMGLPDVDYTNPTVEKGWQHALTMPRQLIWKNDHLYQLPLEEMKALRQEQLTLKPGRHVLEHNVYEMEIDIDQEDFQLQLREDFVLDYQDGLITITMKEAGYGRDVRHVQVDSLKHLHIFSDTSSLEIFINHGYTTITTRIYSENTTLTYSSGEASLYYLDDFKIEKKY